MRQQGPQSSPHQGRLNEYQARRLRVACHYIDKLLCEIEVMLDAASSKAAFPRYSADVAPKQRRIIEDYVAQIREKLIVVLNDQGTRRESPSISASHAIHVVLGTIDIAVEELKPRYMRGYGDVSEAAAEELNRIVGELRGLVSQLDHHVARIGKDAVHLAHTGKPQEPSSEEGPSHER